MFTALTFFDCMMARVQVPMAAVEFVVGYHDLVLSLVGLHISQNSFTLN